MKTHRKSCFVSVRSPRNSWASRSAPELWPVTATVAITSHQGTSTPPPSHHLHVSAGVPGQAGAPSAAPGPHLAACLVSEASRPLTPPSLLLWLREWKGDEVRAGRSWQTDGGWGEFGGSAERRGRGSGGVLVLHNSLLWPARPNEAERWKSSESSLEDSSLLLSPLHLTLYYHGEISEELVAVWLVLVDGRRVLVLQVRSFLQPE